MKRLITLIKSELNYLITSKTNKIRVAELKLSELDRKIRDAKSQAGDLHVQQRRVKEQIIKCESLVESSHSKAVSLKAEGKVAMSKAQLKIKKDATHQVTFLNKNYDSMGLSKDKLEMVIDKIKGYQIIYRGQIGILKARKDAGEIIQDFVLPDVGGDLSSLIGEVELEVENQEVKNDYIENLDGGDTTDVDLEYENL